MPQSLPTTGLPLQDPDFEAQFRRVTEFSRYANDVISDQPHWLAQAWADGVFQQAPKRPAMQSALDQLLTEAETEAEQSVEQALRVFRHRQLLLCLWRDLNDYCALATTLKHLTLLAEVLIDAALSAVTKRLSQSYGQPCNAEGAQQQMVVLGMGKLGGGELNFSSDVDLIFTYPEGGETNGKRTISNEQYFSKVARQTSRCLSQPSSHGWVYRVDLRLRPFGEAGRLAHSFVAMEQYYQREGREWERYALIKARPVAGDIAEGKRLLTNLRAFIYRRYLDYGAFEALREMKAMIRAEVSRQGLEDDIKLGPGGIREIEFVVQAFQLIRGGREPRLRHCQLLSALKAVQELGLLQPTAANHLGQAYRFLRRLENRLQQVADEQTHRLPQQQEQRERIAQSLGLRDWPHLQHLLQRHRQRVAACFQAVFEPQHVGDNDDQWQRLWHSADQTETVAERLHTLNFHKPHDGARLLQQFKAGGLYRSLGQRSRLRLDRLMPRLLRQVAEFERPDIALEQTMRIVQAIAARSAYVVLMTQYPAVLSRLVHLCGNSPWITDTVAKQPLLLDDLIDDWRLEQILEPDALAEMIERRIAQAEDEEAEQAALREVQQSQALSVAAAALDGRLDQTQVAARLSQLADTIINSVVNLAWRDLAARHSRSSDRPTLAVIAYGTLGSKELNYDSDLDLVFLYDGAIQLQPNGQPSTSNEAFYARVSQRILNMLTTLLAGGRLYPVDVRLRPNGSAGLLVSSIAAFAKYQRERAWTWELQALARARWVAGDENLKRPFINIRSELLQRQRDPQKLKHDVAEMRAKMRQQLDRGDPAYFDIKQGPGGKVDIEFIVQYACLRWSHQYPELLTTTHTSDLLTMLGKSGVISGQHTGVLIRTHGIWLQQMQRLALLQRPSCLREPAYVEMRGQVIDIWRHLFS